MEPEIRFCTSADGTLIAYATYGEPAARALVCVPSFESARESAWKHPGTRALYEGLASGRRLVTFDRRGVGGSQRDVDDLAIPAQVADIAAVVDQLGLKSFDLMGIAHAGALAAAYAVEHPERVGRLVLRHPLVRTSGPPLQGYQDAAQSIRANWSLARRSMATILYPNGPAELQRRYSNVLRDSITPEVAARHFEAVAEFDGSATLRSVQVPTLVLAMSDRHDLELVRAVAPLIPDARLVMLEGDWGTLAADPSQSLAAIRNFLDEGEEPAGAPPRALGGLVTILFTDMESSTALRRKLGDAQVQELVRAHNEIVRAALSGHDGREIKHTGDGIMASFPTATSALQCGIDIQRGVAAHVEEHPDAPLGVYVGLNAGEPIAEEEDLFGTSVDLAARICAHAEPGQILASNVVRELSEGKGFLFGDIGDVVPKGFEEPVRLYEVRWRAEGSP